MNHIELVRAEDSATPFRIAVALNRGYLSAVEAWELYEAWDPIEEENLPLLLALAEYLSPVACAVVSEDLWEIADAFAVSGEPIVAAHFIASARRLGEVQPASRTAVFRATRGY